MILERANLEKIEDDEILNKIKKHIVHINNYCTTKHLEKNEKAMAKYFIDTANKFMYKDYDLYITLKNNLSCYNIISGHNFVAKGLLTDLLKVNTIKKIEEISRDKSIIMLSLAICLSDIVANYTNLSSIDCRMKSHHDGLINSMHALALSGLQNIFKKDRAEKTEAVTVTTTFNLDTDLSLNYYNLGVQQEFMRRRNDCEISFGMSKKYCEVDNVRLKKKLNCEVASKTTTSKFHKEAMIK
jgi:hypothetical protein